MPLGSVQVLHHHGSKTLSKLLLANRVGMVVEVQQRHGVRVESLRGGVSTMDMLVFRLLPRDSADAALGALNGWWRVLW